MFIYLFDDANKTIMHWSIFGMEIRCLTTLPIAEVTIHAILINVIMQHYKNTIN